MRQNRARAMYDQIEHALISITMQLRSAIDADAGMPSRVNGEMSGGTGPLHRAGWARQAAAELGSVIIYTLGLVATIEWHLRQFRKCTGILCELTVNHSASLDLPDDYAETIFGIYSEALSNVARHAGASRVAIALTITPREVTLVARDNGIGLGEEASRASRGGIAAMRVRAQSHKGLCEFVGARNTGTTVTASLPIARAS
jgi:signal transduction histidine kinase